MAEELKDCPFCGGKASNERNMDYDWVECSSCDAQTDYNVNKDKAIQNWNNRVTGESKCQKEK